MRNVVVLGRDAYQAGQAYARDVLSGQAPAIEREGILEGMLQVQKGASREVVMEQEARLYARIYGESLERAKAYVRGFWAVIEPTLDQRVCATT